jgi:hypothetical protein
MQNMKRTVMKRMSTRTSLLPAALQSQPSVERQILGGAVGTVSASYTFDCDRSLNDPLD